MLRSHYEKILFPFDVFRSGAMTGDVLVGVLKFQISNFLIFFHLIGIKLECFKKLFDWPL